MTLRHIESKLLHPALLLLLVGAGPVACGGSEKSADGSGGTAALGAGASSGMSGGGVGGTNLGGNGGGAAAQSGSSFSGAAGAGAQGTGGATGGTSGAGGVTNDMTAGSSQGEGGAGTGGSAAEGGAAGTDAAGGGAAGAGAAGDNSAGGNAAGGDAAGGNAAGGQGGNPPLDDDYDGTITELSVRANPNSVLSAYVSWTTEAPASSVVQFGVEGLQWEVVDETLVTEHDVLVIGMRAETEYQIRAVSGLAEAEETFTTGTLPEHIPVAEVDINDADRVQPGWTLMNVQRGDGQPNAQSNAPPTAVAYDAEGYPVWYFVNGSMNERGGAISVDPTDVGVLFGPTLSHSPIEVDWAGNELWSCSNPLCGSEQISHHANKLSNGDYMVQRDVASSPDHRWEQHTPGSDTPVHSISLSDALTSSNAGFDWAHGNAVTVDLENDVAYMSFRWLGVVKMQYSTQEMLWHLPASYADSNGIGYTPPANMQFVPPDSQFSDIHDPEVHDDGTILIFDNGGFTGAVEEGNPADNHTRALEYAIDEENLTATLVWEWPGDFDVDEFYRTDYYVPFWGDADRLENGNVMIAAGRSGSAPETPVSRVTEVAKDDGQVVWELRMPREQGADYGIYRAERVYPLPLVRAIAE